MPRKKKKSSFRLDKFVSQPTHPSPAATTLPEISIEQQLDMVEGDGRGLRGDDVLHQHGVPPLILRSNRDPIPATELLDRFEMDMSEPDREGDELSGDDHSSGLQGEDPETAHDPHIAGGMPGEEGEDQSLKGEDLEHRRAI